MTQKQRLDLLTRTVLAIQRGKRCRLNDAATVFTIDNRAAALLAASLMEIGAILVEQEGAPP